MSQRPPDAGGFSRRRLLQGALGATLALPWLESWSAPRATARPSRFVLCSGGFSTGVSHDVEPRGVLDPDGIGAAWTMPAAMAALAGLQSELSVFTGMSVPVAADGELPGPAGRTAGVQRFHAHQSPLVAGVRQREGCEVCYGGPTPDQLVADVIGASTPFRSLSLRAQVDGYTPQTHDAYGNLSWRQVGDRVVANPPIVSPKLAWLLLTGSTDTLPDRMHQLDRRRSVLDLVDGQAQALLKRVGARDRDRLERHLDAVRDLELRLVAPEGGSCGALADPGEDPDGGGRLYRGEDERARRLNEIAVYALSCDLTRSLAMMYTHWRSDLGTGAIAPFDWALHDVMHLGTREQLIAVVGWHMSLWADLLERMRATPDGEGTLLDHCAVAFQPEGGIGPEDSPDRSHSTEGMVTLLAGRAGGLAPGRHVPLTGRHPASVLIAAMQAVGVGDDALGEVVGGADEAFG